MTKDVEDAAATSVRGGAAYRVLIALVVGLLAGAGAQSLGDGLREPALQVAGFIGGLWLNALKMTVIPLVVALLVIGIAKGAEAARAGRIAGRTVLWIVIICTASAIFGALMIELLTGLFPLPLAQAQAMQAGLAGLDQSTASGPMPGVADFFKGIVPDNVISAAAKGEVLPLVVFAMLFALAVTRIESERRRSLTGLFEAIADALLIIIGWVLWIAPLGVLALAFSVGASAGGAAFAGLGHYIVLISVIGILVTLWAYPIGAIWGRAGFGTFSKAMIAPQSVAISTRSSLASLPAMLAAARVIGVRDQVADVSLPLSVALFRATGPGDEHCGRILCGALARLRADHDADHRGDGRRGGDELRSDQFARRGELHQLDRADRHGAWCAHSAARAAGRRGDGAGHFPHARQCQHGRRGDNGGRPQRRSSFREQRNLKFVEPPPDERPSSTRTTDCRPRQGPGRACGDVALGLS